jgi:hypothetical protein
MHPPPPLLNAPPATKLLNVWHASHLATLLPPNVTANVVSPGWVPGTQLSRHVAGALLTAIVGTLVSALGQGLKFMCLFWGQAFHTL